MRPRPSLLGSARLLAVATATAVALGAAAPARADVPGEEVARRAFEEGVALEKKAAYADALVKFRESSAIKPTLGNRYHTAYCLEMTGKLAAALSEYEAVDRAAHEQRKNDVIEATRLRVEPLRPRVPQLAIKVAEPAPPGLAVALDDEAVAAVLLDGRSFRVEPGVHTVKARATGREDFSRALNVSEGSSTAVEVTLPEAARGREGNDPSFTEPPRERPKRSLTAPLLFSGGAVLFAGGGVAAFLAAGSAQSDARATCPTKQSCTSEQQKVRTLDTLSLVGFAGALALGVTAAIVWTRPVSRTASVAVRGSWLGVEGTFE